MNRRIGIEFDPKSPLYKSVLVMEECYDSDRPFMQRLEKLGYHLSQVNLLSSPVEELLVWAAAIRWLWRSRARDFAKTCKEQYEIRCNSATNGKCHDVLQVLKDIKIDEV